jgi:hypothetical protein
MSIATIHAFYIPLCYTKFELLLHLGVLTLLPDSMSLKKTDVFQRYPIQKIRLIHQNLSGKALCDFKNELYILF